MREMLLGAYIRQKRLELGLTRQQGGKFFHIRGPSFHFSDIPTIPQDRRKRHIVLCNFFVASDDNSRLYQALFEKWKE